MPPPADLDDGGWDPAWDVPEADERRPATGAPPTASWASFFSDCNTRAEAAMRSAGIDPKRPAQPVSRHGVKLVDGLPVDGRLRCWACDTPLLSCPARLECVPCLEIFRARADVLGHDVWERAFFCTSECFCKNWESHRSRHGVTTSTPSRSNPVVNTFPAPPDGAALWDGERLKRVAFELS